MICRRCNRDKLQTEFCKDKNYKSGYKKLCIECHKIQMKEYRNKNQDKTREYNIRWKKENKDYYEDYLDWKNGKNPNFVPKTRDAKYTDEENRQRKLEASKRYREQHQTSIVSRRQANREKENAKQKQRVTYRRKHDPCYRIKCNLRDRVKRLTKNCQTERLAEYDELFGCTIEQYKTWIESHWLEGMNWDNWGLGNDKWNLDHHYPLSAFDLTKRSQQLVAMHYTNTYPMWSRDNISKNDTIPIIPRENLYIPDFAVPR